MKILQLIFNLSTGGAEKFTVDLSNKLSETDEVYLVVIQNEKDDLGFFKERINDRVNYINLGFEKGINFKTFFTIFRLLNQIQPDVIHAHLNVIIYLYLPSLVYKNKIKFIHTLHNLAPKTIGYKWQRVVNRFFYKKKIIVPIAISKECKVSFIDFYKINEIKLIENGVSNPKISDRYEIVKEEILKLKQKPSDTVFIHVAGYSEQKNQDLLIDAFNEINKLFTNYLLLVLGPNYNSPDGQILKTKSNSRIHFLGAKSNVSDYLLNSDVFVLSSLWEGLPISLLEALSCGVVPVCTPAGGIPDVIIDESIGYVSKDFSEEQFYLTIKKCLENIENLKSKNLISYFKNNFSMEKCAFKYRSIYKS